MDWYLPALVAVGALALALVALELAVWREKRRWRSAEARLEVLSRELAERGWKLLAAEPDDPSNVRRAQATKHDVLVDVRVGCTPVGDWCVAIARWDLGISEDISVRPPARDRDGERQESPEIDQPAGGEGFVVQPPGAREQLPMHLAQAFAGWPAGDGVWVHDGRTDVRRSIASAADVDALVDDVHKRLVASRPRR